MIEATLVSGRSAAAREAAIASALAAERFNANAPGSAPAAVLLEGLPTGQAATPIDALAQQHRLLLVRTAPGCLCCTGRLTLQVHVNRLLRRHPSRLFIGIADRSHLPSLRELLEHPPYDGWMRLTADLCG